MLGRLRRDRLMADGVEHRDDLAVHVDDVGHVHLHAERPPDPLGQDGLAVAGRAIQKQRLARIDGRPQLVEHLLVDDEMLEAGGQQVAIDVRARRHAGPGVGVVLGERDRRRADVAAHVEVLIGAIAAEVGQDVPVAGRADAGRAADLDQLFGPRVLDELFEHRIRQPQLVREAGAADFSADQRLQQELRQRVRVQPRLRDRRGRRQRRRLGRAWQCRCDGGERPGHNSCPFSRANTMRWPSAVPDASSVPDGSSSTPAVPRTGSRMRHGFRPET